MPCEENQPGAKHRVPLSYEQAPPRSGRMGIVSLGCGLVSPCVYILIFVLHSMGLHPGFQAALTMVMVALGSALAGLYLSFQSLQRESKKRWALAGLVFSGLSLCFNCRALSFA